MIVEFTNPHKTRVNRIYKINKSEDNLELNNNLFNLSFSIKFNTDFFFIEFLLVTIMDTNNT